MHVEACTEDQLGHCDENVDTTAPCFVFFTLTVGVTNEKIPILKVVRGILRSEPVKFWSTSTFNSGYFKVNLEKSQELDAFARQFSVKNLFLSENALAKVPF